VEGRTSSMCAAAVSYCYAWWKWGGNSSPPSPSLCTSNGMRDHRS
jgi:hypothetical protein